MPQDIGKFPNRVRFVIFFDRYPELECGEDGEDGYGRVKALAGAPALTAAAATSPKAVDRRRAI
jgi:hypothetical protein